MTLFTQLFEMGPCLLGSPSHLSVTLWGQNIGIYCGGLISMTSMTPILVVRKLAKFSRNESFGFFFC